MNRRNNFIKFMLIFGILLLTLLLITLFSLFKLLFFKEEKIVKREIEVNYTLDNVNNINLDFKKATVVIKVTKNEELSIIQNTKEEKMFLNINKTKTNISIDEDSNIFNGADKKYIVKIPKSYTGIINIKNGFGTINIYNSKSSIYLDNNSGEINIYKCNNVTIKDVSGRLNLYDIDGSANLASSTGDINIKGIKGILNIDTLTGDVIVNNFKIEGDSKIINISGDISAVINKDSICKINKHNENGSTNINKDICNGKKNILEVENVTGNINIK